MTVQAHTEGLAHSGLTASVHTWAVVAVAATLLAGCEVGYGEPAEPERFRVVTRTWREGFATNPTTSALIEDTATGCLYSLAERKGVAPVLTRDGVHAGCLSAPPSPEQVGGGDA